MAETAERITLLLFPINTVHTKFAPDSISPGIRIREKRLFVDIERTGEGHQRQSTRENPIVVHGAAYAQPFRGGFYGSIGKKLRMSRLPQAITRPIINTIKGGSVMFIYANNQDYMAQSSILKGLQQTKLLTRNPIPPSTAIESCLYNIRSRLLRIETSA